MMRSLILSLLFIVSTVLSAQDYPTIGFKGKVYTGNEKGESVQVTLFEKNREISSYETEKNGKFILDLDRNKYYVIQFSKDEFVTKRLVIDTRIAGEDYPKNSFKFDVSLIREVEGVDYSPLDFPMAIIQYYENNSEFNYDLEYTRARVEEEKELVNLDPFLAMN